MTRHNRPDVLPLFAWGEALRRQRERRVKLARRCLAVAGGCALLGFTTLMPPDPFLIWNASPSAPVGLYAVAPGRAAQPGDYVIARLPARWRSLTAKRHYLPANVPLVKRVEAHGGDDICAFDDLVEINGRIASPLPIST